MTTLGNSYGTIFSDFRYDVFLGFSGNVFGDRLCESLRDKGMSIFRSEDCETRPAIEEIEKSKMVILVLCHNYPFSTKCLDELTKITEYVDNNIKQVWPIFYKVEPSDVRKQNKSYKIAMDAHQIKYGHHSKKVKSWREALTRLCDLCGLHCKDDMFEGELEKIVEAAYSKLAPVPVQLKHAVGLDYHFEQVKSFLDVESNDTVCMLGIYGVGGIGKTTFAAYLYEKIRHYYFEAATFLIKVKQYPNKSKNHLEDLQKTLLSLLGVETGTMIGSTNKGETEIKRRLGHRRVLLVLDDVDSKEQLESLVGRHGWFGSGSRIVITTRDEAVLDYGVGIKKYKMEELNDCDSLQLFCLNAFDKPGPAKNFQSISHRAVSYAKGVPLALQVIGSNLKGKRIEDWEIELGKYRKVPNAAIQGVLEISYYSLPEPEIEIFLDIACFFKGEKLNYVKRILKASDLSFQVLACKCLIMVDENGCLEMHDLIQDMGREIVRKQSPSNPGDRSRLWSHQDILKVLKENSGSEKIVGIMLHPPKLEEVDGWTNNAFDKMKNLRILIVRNTKFSTGPSYLPNNLRLLDWIAFPSEYFPSNFYPENIVDFNLSHSPLVSVKPLEKVFQDLTFINLSRCQFITEIPNMYEAKNLRVLTIDKCHNLEGFHQSVGRMPNLVYLSASECSMLRSFVQRMYLPSLKMLSFNFCSKLGEFPEVVGKMDKALKIHMINTAIEKFPGSICKLTGLEYVDMSTCRELKDLSCFVSLPKLVTLKMNGCSQLAESIKKLRKSHSEVNRRSSLKTLYLSKVNLSDLSIILEIFPELEYLNVSHNEFEFLPECIKGSLQLKNLDVSFCRNLREIPELPSSIQIVDARYCQSLTTNASSMLFSKVYKEMERIQVVVPETEIPEGFLCTDSEDMPLFWARQKFPVIALAFVFKEVKKMDTSELFPGVVSAEESYAVGLNLFIDGQEICRKDHHYCYVGDHHVLVCDLHVLFNDEEWQGLDAYLGDDWKAIQVQCESTLILSRWGAYVYKQKNNTDDILFSFPNSTSLIPKTSPQKKTRHVESYDVIEKFGQNLNSFKIEQTVSVANMILNWWRNAKADIRGEASASTYDTSLLQEHEDVVQDVAQILEMLMENLPKHISDSQVQITGQLVVELLVEQAQHMKEYGHEKLQINLTMPIVLVECQCQHCTDLDGAQSLRYWGTVELEEGDPRVWKIWQSNQLFKERLNYSVMLKCIEEASYSGHGESLVEEYNDPELQALMREIEEDAMSLNESHGKLKASIIPMDVIVSDKYLLETAIIRGLERLGRLGINFNKTAYGKLRVEHKAHSTSHMQNELRSSTLRKRISRVGLDFH